MAKRRKTRVRFTVADERETRPLQIVSAPELGLKRPHDGVIVPLVRIDTAERSDVASLFAAYRPDTIGDVGVQWGRRDGAPAGTVTLFIQFIQPVR